MEISTRLYLGSPSFGFRLTTTTLLRTVTQPAVFSLIHVGVSEAEWWEKHIFTAPGTPEKKAEIATESTPVITSETTTTTPTSVPASATHSSWYSNLFSSLATSMDWQPEQLPEPIPQHQREGQEEHVPYTITPEGKRVFTTHTGDHFTLPSTHHLHVRPTIVEYLLIVCRIRLIRKLILL